jgi:glycerophosphoryl diester phosphodiesterase
MIQMLGALIASVAFSAGAFDHQGHRGARGLLPENTMPSFQKALDLGVDTLECDMAITKDGVVVLYHDLWLNPDITRGPDGKWLEKRGKAIVEMTFEELQAYDVGRIKPGTDYAREFPDQVGMDGMRIPKLSDLFDLVKKSGNSRVNINCETKVNPFQVQATYDPADFTRLVVAEIRNSGMAERTMVHSFHWDTLQLIQKEAPEIRTVYVVNQRSIDARQGGGDRSPWLSGFDPSRYGGSLPKAVKAAGGRILSVNHPLVTKAMVEEARALGVAVIPWTVNDVPTINKLLDMGVDGIITDRPDLVRQERARRKK